MTRERRERMGTFVDGLDHPLFESEKRQRGLLRKDTAAQKILKPCASCMRLIVEEKGAGICISCGNYLCASCTELRCALCNRSCCDRGDCRDIYREQKVCRNHGFWAKLFFEMFGWK